MSKLIYLRAVGCSLVALSMACSWSAASQQKAREPERRPDGTCSAPPLAYLEVVAIAERGVQALGGGFDELRRHSTITVSEAGCDYLFLAVPTSEKGNEEPLSMVIDRAGRITSWPWCCVPSIFVPPGVNR
jgi:hypothetical protein